MEVKDTSHRKMKKPNKNIDSFFNIMYGRVETQSIFLSKRLRKTIDNYRKRDTGMTLLPHFLQFYYKSGTGEPSLCPQRGFMVWDLRLCGVEGFGDGIGRVGVVDEVLLGGLATLA